MTLRQLTFNPPSVIVKSNDAGEAKAVEGPSDVPIKDETGSVACHNLITEANDEGV